MEATLGPTHPDEKKVGLNTGQTGNLLYTGQLEERTGGKTCDKDLSAEPCQESTGFRMDQQTPANRQEEVPAPPPRGH